MKIFSLDPAGYMSTGVVLTGTGQALGYAKQAQQGWSLFQALRKIKPVTASRWLKKKMVLNVLTTLHEGLVHNIRTLEYCAIAGNIPQASLIASAICTDLKVAMSDVLGIKSADLHCAIKLMFGSNANLAVESVATFQRSKPPGARGVRIGHASLGPVTSHSAWCACLGGGRNDGKNVWNHPYCAFVSNDLRKEGTSFACSRAGWENDYNSMLAFPMRRASDATGMDYEHVGFLVFDSLKTDIFYDAPRTFDKLATHEYREKLASLAYFHVGAMAADLLAFAFYNITGNGNGGSILAPKLPAGPTGPAGNPPTSPATGQTIITNPVAGQIVNSPAQP